MMIRKINNVPSNIGAYVVGRISKEESDKAGQITGTIFLLIIAGTIFLNYKYHTGKL